MNSRRKTVLSIGLVVLVALAGCTSGLPGSSSGNGSTDKDIEDMSLPDGASDEAVANGSALAETHADLLSQRGYEVELTVSYDEASESGTSTYVVQRDAETGELYQRTVRESGDEEGRVFAYANDSATYQKRGTDDPRYSVDTSRAIDSQGVPNIVKATGTLVPLGNWTDPTVVSKGGRTLVEYDLGGISNDRDLLDAATVSNASGSLLVDQQGIVHRVTIDVTREQGGTTSEARYDYRVTELGDVAVERPEWVSVAAEQAEQEGPTRVSNRVGVVSVAGAVENGTVETVDLVVRQAAGADDINLSKATVQWIGPHQATTLTSSDGATETTFAVEAVKDGDGSAPVLNEQSDRLKISMDANEIGSGLESGDEVQLTLTTQYGSKTTYWISVPEDISGESVVSL